jgi:hypothetical protein
MFKNAIQAAWTRNMCSHAICPSKRGAAHQNQQYFGALRLSLNFCYRVSTNIIGAPHLFQSTDF